MHTNTKEQSPETESVRLSWRELVRCKWRLWLVPCPVLWEYAGQTACLEVLMGREGGGFRDHGSPPPSRIGTCLLDSLLRPCTVLYK